MTGVPRVPASDNGPSVGGRAGARPRLGRVASTIVWTVAALEVALVSVLQIVTAPARENTSPIEVVTLVLTAVMVAAYGLLGALTATRIPRNPIGWILWVMAALLTMTLAGTYYVPLNYFAFNDTLPAVELISWLGGFGFNMALGIGLTFIPLLFPDGRFLSPRWRIVGWYAALGLTLSFVTGALGAGSDTGADGASGSAATAVLGPWGDASRAASSFIILSASALAVAAAIVRFRRGDRTERQQLKWFAAAVVLAVGGLTVATAIGDASSELLVSIGGIAWATAMVGVILIPIGISIAVLRYRLYEIDRIISRTISWAAITGTLVVAFVGLVLGMTALLGSVAGGSTFAVAGSTLVVFALFQPVRRRIQRGVDRRFDRTRYDGERIVALLGSQLRGEVDLESIEADVMDAVVAAVRPASAASWLLGPSRPHGRKLVL